MALQPQSSPTIFLAQGVENCFHSLEADLKNSAQAFNTDRFLSDEEEVFDKGVNRQRRSAAILAYQFIIHCLQLPFILSCAIMPPTP